MIKKNGMIITNIFSRIVVLPYDYKEDKTKEGPFYTTTVPQMYNQTTYKFANSEIRVRYPNLTHFLIISRSKSVQFSKILSTISASALTRRDGVHISRASAQQTLQVYEQARL